MKRKLKKLKKKALACAQKARALAKKLYKKAQANALLLLLLIQNSYLIVRVEVLNDKFQKLTSLMGEIGFGVYIKLSVMQEQFQAAILSILSLFGGTES